MLTLYFSGTGNTKYAAERFSKTLGFVCHSIEEDINFAQMIRAHTRICVCYPIYGSRMPRFFKEFVLRHQEALKGKEIIILATQLIGSGDGARCFVDVFPKNHFKVIYAEHINMPNNVCNVFFLPVKNGAENQNKLKGANKRIDKICENLRNGKTVKRGFNIFSRILGLGQGAFENIMNNRGKRIKVRSSCNNCGICVKICPMKNLKSVDEKISHNNNCSICYRCVNKCPQKAITTFFHVRPKKQYHGIDA